MHGALAGRDRVGVSRLDAETRTAVLHRNARFRAHHAGAKREIQRIDKGADIAPFIRHRQIDRIALEVGGHMRELGGGLFRVDFVAQGRDELIRQQLIDRHMGKGRIGDKRVAHGIGQARRLNLGMESIRTNRIKSL